MVGVFRRLANFLFTTAAMMVGAAPAHADMAEIHQNDALEVVLYKGPPPFSGNVRDQLGGINVALANALGR